MPTLKAAARHASGCEALPAYSLCSTVQTLCRHAAKLHFVAIIIIIIIIIIVMVIVIVYFAAVCLQVSAVTPFADIVDVRMPEASH